eukprot:jgi/Tetstr1/421950/TSEL_012849.t1
MIENNPEPEPEPESENVPEPEPEPEPENVPEPEPEPEHEPEPEPEPEPELEPEPEPAPEPEPEPEPELEPEPKPKPEPTAPKLEAPAQPEIDIIVSYLTFMDARHGNIDGIHRREAKRMVRYNYPETYHLNKGICYTSDKMYIGMSPEVCRYMSIKLNEACHTVVGDTSMHKLLSDSADLPVGQMYLVVGLLVQGEYYATPNLYELVHDVKDADDDDPMDITHTNAEWLAKIETGRFRDRLRRAGIMLMNVIDTAEGRKPIELLTPNEPAGTWGEYLSDHIKAHDVSADVSDEQAAARLDAITRFRAKVDDLLGPSGLPKRFSTSIILGYFKDSAKLKDENRQTLNKYQKPIALFSKHLKMAATDGTTIVDVTAGTGTTAVREGCNPID